MTPWEICREYRQAQNKSEQVKILADLNMCSKNDIINLLAERGIEHKEGKKRGRKPSAIPKIVGGLTERKKIEQKRNGRYIWTEERVQILLRLYDKGNKPKEIAEILGIDAKKVTAKLCRLARTERKVLIQ